jgi:molybdopterin-guanine dinucleotide biosynthesis protein
MPDHYFFSSLTRISDLSASPFTVSRLPREGWATGDYVVTEVIPPVNAQARVELSNGRMAPLLAGDLIVGAFGIRRATLEIVGDWQSIGADERLDNLTTAGLFGRVTSKSYLLSPPTSLIYRGHVLRENEKVSMKDFVPSLPESAYHCPTIMIIGTSMSAGKTTTARIIIHQLKQLGLKVVGAKLTGAGRYRDILAMADAGADGIFDFVDVGLPSSICAPEAFRTSLRQLLTLIAAENPDVAVVEAGASPFEPYNGAIVLEEMRQQICLTVLCASDPYAVIGVSQSFGIQPDLISGTATSTSAGVELVEKLAGVKALTLWERDSLPELRELLQEKLVKSEVQAF